MISPDQPVLDSSAAGALERFEALLGPDVFFVPCEWGTKKPRITYTERPKEKNGSEAYRALFEGANIAVYLGNVSGGLCAIDFDEEEKLAAFDAVNPLLRSRLRTRARRGAMVWLRIEGDFPESCSGPDFEWRADKRLSTIWGRHPTGMDYQVLVEAAPVVVRFEEVGRFACVVNAGTQGKWHRKRIWEIAGHRKEKREPVKLVYKVRVG